MRWFSQTPKSIPLAPDTKEKDPTHLLQMLTQTLPFTNPSVHTSGACVDQQVDGQMNGWTAAPACLPFFLSSFPSFSVHSSLLGSDAGVQAPHGGH